ncbi:MAG: mycothiol synthase [Solirubrobacteraceae bacterium]|jgi:ribosomal protein S18 acetylase RimI-like enzyme|nr:mycothiol synthase [Solirubrobacteraceae bacterium]
MEFRPPTRADAEDIVSLLCECDIADFGAPDYDLDALLAEWSEPGVDPERDGFITDGAYGLLMGTDARAWVHPTRRGEPLLEPLLDRLEARARERGLEFVDRQVPRSDPADRALLESRGYALVRSYADMRLPDDAVGSLPSGGDVRPYDAARDEAAVQELVEHAFAGGAGRVESLESLRTRAADTTLWFVADAPGGGPAGAIRSELRPAGFITGYIAVIAVAPEHRGRGLAGRLVGTAARELVARGAVTIRLHVRSSNPDALRLYERLGFTGSWRVDEFRLALG